MNEALQWILGIYGGLTVAGILAVARTLWSMNKTIGSVGTDLKVFIAHAEMRFARNEQEIKEIKEGVERNHDSIKEINNRFKPDL